MEINSFNNRYASENIDKNDPKYTTAMNKELYDYKRKIGEFLLSSDSLVEGINASVEPSELMYNNVFPFGTVPGLEDEAKCMLTIEVVMPNVSRVNNFFKDVIIVITVICHNDMMQTDFGIPRHDFVSAKIIELLEGNTQFGYGTLRLISNTEGAFTTQHSGRTMRFQTQELSKKNMCV